MTVRFFRRHFIEALIPSQAGETPPLRIFELTVGLQAAVDPLSGMTVNLTIVDQWFSELPKAAVYSSEFQALESFQQHLRVQGQQQAVLIAAVELKEDRRWWALTQRGPEVGERKASRQVTADGRSIPVWEDTLCSPSGDLLERREVTMDGNTAQSYFPEFGAL